MHATMSELASSYLDSKSRTEALREEMIQMLRDADQRYAGDPAERHRALRQLQRELYQVILAGRLRIAKGADCDSRNAFLDEAEQILRKRRNSERLSDPPSDMRTIEEERLFSALRVRWFELMRDAGVRRLNSGRQR